MKILVTGAGGYIGTTLVPILLDLGYEVTIYDNLMYNSGDNMFSYIKHVNLNFILGDVMDFNKINKIVNDYDVVIHLAAIVGYGACRKNEKLSYDINHLSTKNIVENLNDNVLLLFGSTGSNYGSVKGICTEESPTNPLSIYAITKELGEKEVMKRKNSIAFRFATAFGLSPRLRLDLLVNDFTYQAYSQKYLAVYESHFMRTFIHVKDIANSFIFAIKNSDKMSGNVYNVGSNNMNYSKKDVCELIKERIDGLLIHYADFDGDADKRDYIVSYDKISTLGFETTISVEEGIEELLKAYPLINIENKYKNI